MKKLCLAAAAAIVMTGASMSLTSGAVAQSYTQCVRYSVWTADNRVGFDKRGTAEWDEVQQQELEKCVRDSGGDPNSGGANQR